MSTKKFKNVIKAEDTFTHGSVGDGITLDVLELRDLSSDRFDGVEGGEDTLFNGVGRALELRADLVGKVQVGVGEAGVVVLEHVLDVSCDGAVEASQEEVGSCGREDLVGEGEHLGGGLALLDGVDDLIDLDERFVDTALDTEDGDEDADKEDGVDDESEGDEDAAPLGGGFLLLVARLIEGHSFVVVLDGHLV